MPVCCRSWISFALVVASPGAAEPGAAHSGRWSVVALRDDSAGWRQDPPSAPFRQLQEGEGTEDGVPFGVGSGAVAGHEAETEINESDRERLEWDSEEEEREREEEEVEQEVEVEEEMEEVEEAEEEFSHVDIAIASMLLGTVLFVMLLFYLVNWPDEDIRRYAWITISTTMSIFTAVLMFTGINACLLTAVESFGDNVVCFLQYCHMLFWVILLQLMIGLTSGAICEGPEGGKKIQEETWVINDSMRHDYELEIDESMVRNRTGKKSTIKLNGVDVPVAKRKIESERRLRRMKCWGTLFAHMSGFAAINAGGTMQHLPFFRTTPAAAFMPVVINVAIIMCIFSVLKMLRARHHASAKAAGQQGRRAKMYDEETQDAENDISSLSLSFLTTQVVRFKLTGVLPTTAGAEIPEISHPFSVILSLYGFALLSAILTMLSSVAKPKEDESGEEESVLARLVECSMNTCSMMFAWATLFATRWLAFRTTELNYLGIGIHTMGGRVSLALFLSLMCFLLIFALDKVDDWAKTEGSGSQGSANLITTIINAIGILVGLSWEHSFDFGVEALASMTSHPLLCNLSMAAFVALLIVPAWRKYILKKSMQLIDYKKEQEAAVSQMRAGAEGGSTYRSVVQHEVNEVPEAHGGHEAHVTFSDGVHS